MVYTNIDGSLMGPYQEIKKGNDKHKLDGSKKQTQHQQNIYTKNDKKYGAWGPIYKNKDNFNEDESRKKNTRIGIDSDGTSGFGTRKSRIVRREVSEENTRMKITSSTSSSVIVISKSRSRD
ncbi:putative serine/threonine-protein kinase dyrk1 [Vespula maculifrons]|uniref:Serine/threonine-protein kinase dyrk1 n=1 Tax=Vespula maculifrons TaxID=7453 RepID=A0ABD2CTV9_VESMC